MNKIELLNNITHMNTVVKPRYSAELGDNVASTVTFITEFAEVQKEYPILFHKKPDSGEFQAVVLFGIQKDENLFLTGADGSGWAANYIPAVMARGPFSIGLQTQVEGGVEMSTPVVHIDMSHPKVGSDEGVSLFLEGGGNSEYLQRISSVLNLIRDGMPLTKLMFDAFDRYQLLEDVTIDIELDNGDKFTFANFKTINEDKLLELNGDALSELNRAGFLRAAHFVLASMSNMKKLIEIKNRSNRSE